MFYSTQITIPASPGTRPKAGTGDAINWICWPTGKRSVIYPTCNPLDFRSTLSLYFQSSGLRTFILPFIQRAASIQHNHFST